MRIATPSNLSKRPPEAVHHKGRTPKGGRSSVRFDMSWKRPNIVNREVQARFWERPGVRFLRATRHSRRFHDVRVRSAHAPRAATKRKSQDFAFVPLGDIPTTTISWTPAARLNRPQGGSWLHSMVRYCLPAHSPELTPPPARRAPRAPWLQDRGGDRACRGDASLAPLPRRSWRHAHIPMCRGP